MSPTVFYGVIRLMDAVAFWLLQRALLAVNGHDSPFAKAVAIDVKGIASLLLNAVAICVAFFSTVASGAILVGVAVMWLVPDRRFEPLIDTQERRSA